MSGKHGKKKKSPVGGILAAVLILALLAVGGFFGWKAYQKKAFPKIQGHLWVSCFPHFEHFS